MGTSPTVAAAESAAGIACGGRGGIVALTAAGLFILSLFFVPLLSYVPQAAIAPVIIITGAMMMQQLQHIDFNDFSEWFPAFLLVVLIPLSGSISIGLAFGFAAYPLLKLFAGQGHRLHPAAYGLGLLFFMLIGLPIPKAVLKPLAQVTAAATPLALIVLGASFHFGRSLIRWRPLAACVAGRLVLVPGIVLFTAMGSALRPKTEAGF